MVLRLDPNVQDGSFVEDGEPVLSGARGNMEPPERGPRQAVGRSLRRVSLPRKRAFILLRYGLIIAAAYVLLAESGFGSVPRTVAIIVLGALVSNFLLHWVPARFFESTVFTASVIVADTAGVTGALLYSGGASTEFFFVYFFVLFLAAIGDNVALIALGAVIVAVGYLYALSRGDAASIWNTVSLIRLPFLFMVATFYGHLIDRLRRERQRTQQKVLKVDRLETAKQELSERAKELQRTSERLKREVAERTQAEQQLESANLKLKRISKRKSDFISTVSHELRTPLTSIKNAIDLLTSGRAGELEAGQRKFLAMASRNTKRLTSIINDLLDLSKIEAGRLEFRFSEMEVQELLDEVSERFKSEAEGLSLTFELLCGSHVPRVWADPHRIDQVLTNLLGNALKFTPAGGRVELRARAVTGGVELRVTDSGVGLSAEEQERIFDRFYQVEDPLSRKVRGTGLGLSIARRLVAAHGGELAVEGEPGKGSSFFFVLPEVSPQLAELHAFDEVLARHQEGQAELASVLVVRPRRDSMGSTASGGSAARLEELQRFIRDRLPRLSDQVVTQYASQRLVIVLALTAKSGAEVVKERLKGLLRRAKDEGTMMPAEILGPAVFPEDGSSGEELIAKASQTE